MIWFPTFFCHRRSGHIQQRWFFRICPHLTVPPLAQALMDTSRTQASATRKVWACSLCLLVYAFLFRMNDFSAQMLQAADRAARIKNDRCAFFPLRTP
jgi:hypothetical protein